MDVTLQWRDNADNESAQRIYASNSPTGSKVLVATVGPNVTTATVTIPAVLESAPVYFTVTAQNDGGESAAMAWHLTTGATVTLNDFNSAARDALTLSANQPLPTVVGTSVDTSAIGYEDMGPGQVSGLTHDGSYTSLRNGLAIRFARDLSTKEEVTPSIGGRFGNVSGAWDANGDFWFSPPQGSANVEIMRWSWATNTLHTEHTYDYTEGDLGQQKTTLMVGPVLYWITGWNSSDHLIRVTQYHTQTHAMERWTLDTGNPDLVIDTELTVQSTTGALLAIAYISDAQYNRTYSLVDLDLAARSFKVYQLPSNADAKYRFDVARPIEFQGDLWVTTGRKDHTSDVVLRISRNGSAADITEYLPPSYYGDITYATNPIQLPHGEIAVGNTSGQHGAYLWLLNPLTGSFRTILPNRETTSKGGFIYLQRGLDCIYQFVTNNDGEHVRYDLTPSEYLTVAPTLQVLNRSAGSRNRN